MNPIAVYCFLLLLRYNVNGDIISDFQRLLNVDQNTINSIIGGVSELFSDSLRSDSISITNVDRVPVPQMIQNEGYPFENHYLTTEDGYILNIHRIPFGKNKKSNGKSVVLQHGLMAASSDWILFGPNHGLAYVLADEGYDVWMPNSRGNLYSRNHTWLSPNSRDFWQFSWHEMGIYDNPAVIDYILNQTECNKVLHVGHSQGTTAFYVMASERPEYNKKIMAHVSLAPSAFMSHMYSPLVKIVALFTGPLEILADMIGMYEYLPNSGFLDLLSNIACSLGVGKILCKNAMFATAGFSPQQMNVSNIPLIMAHYPAGAASKQIIHYGQEVNSGRFEKFDYGFNNALKYKNNEPREYQINRITCPIYIIYGSNDWFAAKVDVEKFYNKLPGKKQIYNIPIQTWNHLDFLFGNDAKEIIYENVVKIFSHFKHKQTCKKIK